MTFSPEHRTPTSKSLAVSCLKQEVHDVQDDMVQCETVVEERCQDKTSGYTTNNKCSKWPREVCRVSKQSVKKTSPLTGCTKEPREPCAPAGCGFKQGREECYDKTKTVVQDAEDAEGPVGVIHSKDSRLLQSI